MRSLTALPPTRGDSVLTAAPRKSKTASGSKQCRAHGSHRSSAGGFAKAAGMAGERSVEACMTKMSLFFYFFIFLNTMHKFCSNNIKEQSHLYNAWTLQQTIAQLKRQRMQNKN